MKRPSFNDAVSQIVQDDPRFNEQVYFFLKEALDFTIKLLNKPAEGPGRHVRGEELLEGIRQFALQEFGPLSMTVLNKWGIHQCKDFGHIVFNMVSKGVLGKTDEDKLEDFAGGYEFETAFRKPFLPKGRLNAPAPSAVKDHN